MYYTLTMIQITIRYIRRQAAGRCISVRYLPNITRVLLADGIIFTVYALFL